MSTPTAWWRVAISSKRGFPTSPRPTTTTVCEPLIARPPGPWIRRPVALVDSCTQVSHPRLLLGESPGNIGRESTWEATCSATGKSPGRNPQVLVCLQEVKRDGVVDAGADACSRELFLKPLAVRHPHDVKVVDWPGPGWEVGNDHRSLRVAES